MQEMQIYMSCFVSYRSMICVRSRGKLPEVRGHRYELSGSKKRRAGFCLAYEGLRYMGLVVFVSKLLSDVS